MPAEWFMSKQITPRNEPLILGIECGGTRTVALMAQGAKALRQIEAGPANLRLLTDAQLLRHFRQLRDALPKPDALGIGMAGARTEIDQARIRRCAEKLWPRIPCWVGHDLEVALAAAGAQEQEATARVLVLSGTGSCVFASFASAADAERIAARVPDEWTSFVARGLDQSPLVTALASIT